MAPLNLPALGRRQPVYRRSSRSHGPVFLVNSRLSRFCAASSRSTRSGLHPTEAPLLPKLRGQFAEFLDRGSPVRLGSVLPAHLRRSAVRAPELLAPGLFSAARASILGSLRPLSHPSRSGNVLAVPPLRAGPPPVQLGGYASPPRPPVHSNGALAVQECGPALHRLRLAASA